MPLAEDGGVDISQPVILVSVMQTLPSLTLAAQVSLVEANGLPAEKQVPSVQYQTCH